MITPSDIFIFLLTVGFISLSGVLMPGPVFAASIIKGAERKHAGAWIALGHLSVEIPLILCIIAGLYYVFMNQWVKAGIGLVGGLFLIFLGIRMIQKRQDKESMKTAFPYHPFIAGAITTISNPYFILWWATVGASLIIWGLVFGLIGVVGLIVVHESCDLGWDYLVAYASYKSRNLWTERRKAYILGICGFLLVVCGIYFMFAFWFG
jgi:threonine/homoserine/homoserine lactone efflux protein